METFTEIKKMVENPDYWDQKQKYISDPSGDIIDAPIVDLINGYNKLPFCFTLQSCFGHFVFDELKDPYSLRRLPISETIARVEYRIAYICFCIKNSDSGRVLLEDLDEITSIDPDFIQLCCAEWFWQRQVNTYALQVQPDRFKHNDSAVLDYKEALHVEKIRDEFFLQLEDLLQNQQGIDG